MPFNSNQRAVIAKAHTIIKLYNQVLTMDAIASDLDGLDYNPAEIPDEIEDAVLQLIGSCETEANAKKQELLSLIE